MSSLWSQISRYAVPAEAQNAEPGGADRVWNCVFATVSVALQVLGYTDTEPEDLRQLIQPGTHAGADFAVVANYLRAHPERWPNLPVIHLYNPADTLAALDTELAAGHLVIMDVYDDQNANVMSGPIAGWGGTHAVIVEGKDAQTTKLWNPWNGEAAGQDFTDSYIKGATTGYFVGNLFVFQRDIRVGGPVMADMTDSERKAWTWDGFVALFGRNPNSEEEFAAIWKVVKPDRTDLYEIRDSMWNDPRAVAHRAATSAQGPKGDKGDAGPKGDAGAAGPPGTSPTKFSITGTAVPA